MTLREGNYYQKLDNELLKLFTKICIDNNIMYNPNEVFTYLRTFPNQYEQISFNL